MSERLEDSITRLDDAVQAFVQAQPKPMPWYQKALTFVCGIIIVVFLGIAYIHTFTLIDHYRWEDSALELRGAITKYTYAVMDNAELDIPIQPEDKHDVHAAFVRAQQLAWVAGDHLNEYRQRLNELSEIVKAMKYIGDEPSDEYMKAVRALIEAETIQVRRFRFWKRWL